MTDSIMKNSPRLLRLPWQLSWFCALVAFAIIGVASWIISMLYSMAGINSVPILIDMWHECIIALIPVIALLLAVWLLFLIIYAPVACAASVKYSNTSRKKTFAEVVLTYCRRFLLFRNAYHFLILSLTERLRTLTLRGLPNHLATGWCHSTHPPVVYE